MIPSDVGQAGQSLWVGALPVVYLAIATAAVFRFRRTPTTYLIAPAMVGLTLRALMFRSFTMDFTAQAVILVVGLISQVALVIGIALIPLSLRKLGAHSGNQPATF